MLVNSMVGLKLWSLESYEQIFLNRQEQKFKKLVNIYKTKV